MSHLIARGAHTTKRHWRKGAVVTAVAATAVAFSGTGVAVAHGLVDSGRIQNQTIRSIDISENGVGASELRKGGSDAAVTSGHIRDNGIRPHDVGDNFEDNVFDEASAVTLHQDVTTPVSNDVDQRIEQITTEANALVTGSATLVPGAGAGASEHVVCFLTDASGDHLAESDTNLADVAHITLVGVTDEAGFVQLTCHTGDVPGSATDMSMTTVELAAD